MILQKKIDNALFLIEQGAKAAEKNGQPLEICYSGGKDSDVILELAKEADVNFRAIYKNTTIDPPQTISHVKSKGVEIVMPKMNFAQIIQKNSFPTRFERFCCRYLKEYKILDKAILGIRKAESKEREKRYKEPVQCRIYSKKKRVEQYLPILEWSDDDILHFITSRGITCHPLYYDEYGEFHVERRVGCMGCPLSSKKNRIEDFKRHPKMVKFWCDNGAVWAKKHPNYDGNGFDDAYEKFVFNLFFSSYDEFKLATTGMFGKVDCKAFLERYFKIEL